MSTAEEFAERVFAAALGAMDIAAIHIGDRLGLYHELAKEPATSVELAARASVDERYVHEWLEQQATSGILTATPEGDHHRFSLPAAHAEVLTDELNGFYMAPLARMLTTASMKMGSLLDVYRDGGGVSWEDFGHDMRESQADMNRPFFANDLGTVVTDFPSVHDRLDVEGSRAVDVGCGAGWSTIALAEAYPHASFVGLDIDEPSIALATANAREAGVSNRVSFESINAAHSNHGAFDVAFAFECVHDMPQPTEVLTAMHDMVKDRGVCIVMDEAVGEEFTGDGGEIEQLMYGFSLLICLPDGRSSHPSVGTGTVMRPSQLKAYATEAGFEGFNELGEAGFFRFYELAP